MGGGADQISLVINAVKVAGIPVILFDGAPETLTSPLREGLSLACIDNLEGAREPSHC